MDAIDEPGAGNFRRYNALRNRRRSASFSSGPVHSLYSGVARLCRVCTDGSFERSRRTARRHSPHFVAQIARLRRIRTRARGFAKNWEWFQWLAEQIDRHSKARTSLTLGAHEVYRDWRP